MPIFQITNKTRRSETDNFPELYFGKNTVEATDLEEAERLLQKMYLDPYARPGVSYRIDDFVVTDISYVLVRETWETIDLRERPEPGFLEMFKQHGPKIAPNRWEHLARAYEIETVRIGLNPDGTFNGKVVKMIPGQYPPDESKTYVPPDGYKLELNQTGKPTGFVVPVG